MKIIPAPAVRAAFTLIELLTVIAIIGILAAIIIPTVGKVRETVQSATCISNLKQLGMAAQAYAADHKDATPGKNWLYPTTASNIDKSGSLMPYLDAGAKWGVNTKSVTTCPIMVKKFPPKEDGNQQYTYTLNSYTASRENPDTAGSNANPDWSLPPTTSNGNPRTLRVSDSNAPSRQALFFDGLAQNENASTHQHPYIVAGDAGNFAQYQRFPHNDSLNIVFLDGHCAKLKKDRTELWDATMDTFWTGDR